MTSKPMNVLILDPQSIQRKGWCGSDNQVWRERAARGEVELFVRLKDAEANTNDARIGEALGCFNAAEVEGWTEALANGDIERIRDIWTRRIAFARAALERFAVETSAEAREDRAYYHGAQQAQAIAHQSLYELDEWINAGCGGRGPALKTTGDVDCKVCRIAVHRPDLCGHHDLDHDERLGPYGPKLASDYLGRGAATRRARADERGDQRQQVSEEG